MLEQPRVLRGAAGALDARIRVHPAPRALAVVCHPHPLHGGTMDNKVVTTLARTLFEAHACTLRFNFRGVGGSAGSHDGGRGEVDDLAAVVAWFRDEFPGLPMTLAGFSFGAMVSLRAAAELCPERLISVAPPAGRFELCSRAPVGCAWTVVFPEADEVVDPAAVEAWLAGLDPAPEVLRFAGASHYFHGRLGELRERLATSLSIG